MNVEKLMSRNVKTCRPEQTLADAARMMWEWDCGCVPIVDDDGRVTGMLTDRDICMGAYSKGRALHDIQIGETMAREIVRCSPYDPIQAAERLMRNAQVRRLVVTDQDGHLAGILSLNDLALEAERTRTAPMPEIVLNDVALTLSAVCKPHAQSARA